MKLGLRGMFFCLVGILFVCTAYASPKGDIWDIRTSTDMGLAVSKSVTVSTKDGADTYLEGKSVTFVMTLSEAYDEPLYAFLKPSDNVVGEQFSGNNPFIVGMTNTNGKCLGRRINRDGTSVEGTVVLQDGYNPGEGGLEIDFEVVLATVQDYVQATNQNKVVKGYNSNTLTLKVDNVEPTINYVTMNGLEKTRASGGKLSTKVAKNREQTFKLR